jgi:hypothetical protein
MSPPYWLLIPVGAHEQREAAMPFCLTRRHRGRRNLRRLLHRSHSISVGAHEQREAAMAICLTRRYRGRRNLRWLLHRSHSISVGAAEQREAAMAACLTCSVRDAPMASLSAPKKTPTLLPASASGCCLTVFSNQNAGMTAPSYFLLMKSLTCWLVSAFDSFSMASA